MTELSVKPVVRAGGPVPWKAPPIPEEAVVSSLEERSRVLTQEQFEELSSAADTVSDALRMEFVNGKMGIKAVPDGNHGRIIVWLQQICMQSKQGFWLFPDQGVHVETYRNGNARPDGALAPIDTFVGQGEWADTEGVLMVVEVTSKDRDTNQRDRIDKPRAYAEAELPVFLLIDRVTGEVKVHSQPDGERYEQVTTVPFGKTVTLPDPVGIELDTEPLTDWAA